VSPHKQGKLLPGSRIPIVAPDMLQRDRPDFMLILPWNLRHEIMGETSYIGDWGGRFVVAIPRIEIEAASSVSQRLAEAV
jgi:hypothetical protein